MSDEDNDEASNSETGDAKSGGLTEEERRRLYDQETREEPPSVNPPVDYAPAADASTGTAAGAASQAGRQDRDYTNKLRSVMAPAKSAGGMVLSALKYIILFGIIGLAIFVSLPFLNYLWDSDSHVLAQHEAGKATESAFSGFIDSFADSLLWFKDPEQAEMEKQQKESVIQVGSSKALEFKGIAAYPSLVYPGDLVDVQFEIKNEGVSEANDVTIYAVGDEDFSNLGGSIGRGGGYGGYGSPSAKESVGLLLPGEPRIYSLLVTAPKCSSKAFDVDSHVVYSYETAGTNDIVVMDKGLYDEKVKQGKMEWFDGKSLTSAGPFTLSTWTSKKQPIPVSSEYMDSEAFRLSFGIYNQKDGDAELAALKIYLPDVFVPAGCLNPSTTPKTLRDPTIDDPDVGCSSYFGTDECQLPRPDKGEDGWYVYEINYDDAVKKVKDNPSEYYAESARRTLAPNQMKMYGCKFFYDVSKVPVKNEKTIFMTSEVLYQYDTKRSVTFSTMKADAVPKCSDLTLSDTDIGTEVIGDIGTLRKSLSKAICLCQQKYGGDGTGLLGSGWTGTGDTDKHCSEFTMDLKAGNDEEEEDCDTTEDKSLIEDEKSNLFTLSNDGQYFWSRDCLVDKEKLQWFDPFTGEYKYSDDPSFTEIPYMISEDMDYTVTVDYYAKNFGVFDHVWDLVGSPGFSGKWAVRVKIDSVPDDNCYKSPGEECKDNKECGKCDEIAGTCGHYLGDTLHCIAPKASAKKTCMSTDCAFNLAFDDDCTMDCQCISNDCNTTGQCDDNTIVIKSVTPSIINTAAIDEITGEVPIIIEFASSFDVASDYMFLIRPAAGAVEDKIDIDVADKVRGVHDYGSDVPFDLLTFFGKSEATAGEILGPITIKISGLDADGKEYTDEVSIPYDLKKPHAVEDFTVENTGKGGELFVRWTPNEDDADIDYYTISLDGVPTIEKTRNSIHYLKDLVDGTSYGVSVVPVDLAGNPGPTVTKAVTPSDDVPPTIRSISISPERIYISSTDFSDISIYVIPSEELLSMTAKVYQDDAWSSEVTCTEVLDGEGDILLQYYSFKCDLEVEPIAGTALIQVTATDLAGKTAVYDGQTFTVYDY